MKILLTIIAMVLLYPATILAQIDNMALRGQGDVRYFGFIKVYDAYLYTDNKSALSDILAPEFSKCLKLEYDVSLTRDNFIEGAITVLTRQHSAQFPEGLKPELSQLHTSYQPVEEGDAYMLCYDVYSSATTLSLNGTDLTTITSKDFSRLYFGIWLGEKMPIDEDLRNDLLNRP